MWSFITDIHSFRVIVYNSLQARHLLGRPLFLDRTIFEDGSLSWPEKIMKHGVVPLDDTEEVVKRVCR